MSCYIIDIEADGPIPGDYSMIEIGAIKLTENLDNTFYLDIKPMTNKFSIPALASIGKTREETCNFHHEPDAAIFLFKEWVQGNNKEGTRPMFFSDNNGFDFMFTHWYFMHFLGVDPFGWTSRNLQDIFRGMKMDMNNRGFKKMRETKHTHNPVDDSLGNAEALLKMIKDMGLKGIEIE